MPLKNLQLYERGRLDLRLSTLARPAQGLGVEPSSLLLRPTTEGLSARGRPRRGAS
jgi:hypothetical protein